MKLSEIIQELEGAELSHEQFHKVLSIFARHMTADDARREAQRQASKKYRENKARVISPSDDASYVDGDSTYLLSSLLSSEDKKVEKEERSEIVALADAWPKDFREQFWAAYPRKVGKKAAIAKLAGVRRSGEVTFADLMAAVGRIDRTEERFIPHPLTWLRQGRYLDVNGVAVGPKALDYARAYDLRTKAQLDERDSFERGEY